MKEVFININDGLIKWIGPKTHGSEPFNINNKDEVIGRTIKMLAQLAQARKEEWSFRISFQPGA